VTPRINDNFADVTEVMRSLPMPPVSACSFDPHKLRRAKGISFACESKAVKTRVQMIGWFFSILSTNTLIKKIVKFEDSPLYLNSE
jgi:hypothetical protein